MIDEALGKVLGMALAYGVSSLGMLLAYVSYRKRVVKAERVFSRTAWLVIAVTVVATVVGAATIVSLARTAGPTQRVETSRPERAHAPAIGRSRPEGPRDRWPLVGLLVPAGIFLVATWLAGSMHRHFSRGVSEKKPRR